MQSMAGREQKIKLFCDKITHSYVEVRHSIVLASLKICHEVKRQLRE